MNDTVVTVIGNVVADPRHRVTANGVHVATIRLATTSRKFDRGVGEWRDNNTMFFNVSCWRSLAGNVVASVHKGDPLVVTGRLRMNSYPSDEGVQRLSPEIDANTVGHDLGRGVADFKKAGRYVAPERRAVPDGQANPWTAESTPEEDPEGTDQRPANIEALEETWDGGQSDTDAEGTWHSDPSHALTQLSATEEQAAA